MKKDVRRSNRLIVFFFVLIVVLIVGSVVAMRVLLRDEQTANGVSEVKYAHHYAFIRPDTNENLWDNVYIGAQAKGEELGVYVEDFGENLTVDYDQEALLQIAIDSGVDGIIIEGNTKENFGVLIDIAAQKNIPVVTVFDDCPESDRISFVGISNYTMGRQYGEQIVGMVRGITRPIKVYVLMDSEHSGNGQDLATYGIADIFAEAGMGERLDIEGVYIDNSSAFSAEEDIRDIFLNNELPDVIVTLNSVYTRCLFQAAVDYNKVGAVRIYGFHDSEDILDAVSKNIIDATISVNTYDMGVSCVEALDEYLRTGYVSTYIAQDTEVILREEATKRLTIEDEDID